MRVFRLSLMAAVVALLVSLAGPGCSGGSTVTPYEFKDFSRLDIQNAFDVDVVQSGTFSIVVTSSKALLDYLSVIQEGETVTVKLSPNHPFTDFVLMRKILKAKITMPVLRGLALSGASRAGVRGFESTSPIDILVSGASTVELHGVETGDARLEVSGASFLNGKLTAADAEFVISGASRVELAGAAEDVTLEASGASRLNLEDFVNKTADVTLSGASQVTIDTRQHLDIALSGASRLFFLSNPKMGKMEVLGASTVKHK